MKEIILKSVIILSLVCVFKDGYSMQQSKTPAKLNEIGKALEEKYDGINKYLETHEVKSDLDLNQLYERKPTGLFAFLTSTIRFYTLEKILKNPNDFRLLEQNGRTLLDQLFPNDNQNLFKTMNKSFETASSATPLDLAFKIATDAPVNKKDDAKLLVNLLIEKGAFKTATKETNVLKQYQDLFKIAPPTKLAANIQKASEATSVKPITPTPPPPSITTPPPAPEKLKPTASIAEEPKKKEPEVKLTPEELQAIATLASEKITEIKTQITKIKSKISEIIKTLNGPATTPN